MKKNREWGEVQPDCQYGEQCRIRNTGFMQRSVWGYYKQTLKQVIKDKLELRCLSEYLPSLWF